MIKNIRHKGLRLFFTTGSTQGIQASHAKRLKSILFRLQFAERIDDMDFPGSNLHPLKGDLKGFWAVNVSGNWRVIFRFEKGHALEVDYRDYH